MKPRILFLVGHTEKAAGAVAFDGTKEWYFNRFVLQHLEAIHNTVSDKKFDATFKTRTSWKSLEDQLEAESYGYDCSIELHFNSFSKIAYGCEAVALEGDLDSIALGHIVAKAISEKHEIKLRHGNGVKEINPSGRGYTNLKVLERFCDASIIIEPCFANFPTNEAKAIIGNADDYARTLYDAVGVYLNVQIIKKTPSCGKDS